VLLESPRLIKLKEISLHALCSIYLQPHLMKATILLFSRTDHHLEHLIGVRDSLLAASLLASLAIGHLA